MRAKAGQLIGGFFFLFTGCVDLDSLCGDGEQQASEECEDSNVVGGDGCSPVCRIECGDGELSPGEECDDDNDNELDACLSTCQFAECGDGFVQDGVELCDDGNQSNNDDCVACQAASCGDGFIHQGVEACDSGAANSDTTPNACRTSCERAGCGDGVIDTSEGCDDGNNTNNDACPNSCQTSRCGDGIVLDLNNNGVVDAGDEQCDDGNLLQSDACLSTCIAARCGDGIIRSGQEQCDDGNQNNFDGCNNTCQLVGPVCGNGVKEGTEQCDDGAQNSDVLADACRVDCTLPSCGDGAVDSGEECDDNNAVNNDTCSNSCTLQLFSETEANDTTATADGPFTPNVFLGGNLVPAGDIDFYQITMTSPGELSIDSSDNTGTNLCDSANNLFIDLFAADGVTTISKNDNAGASGCAFIRQRLDAGTYFLKLREVGTISGVNAYRLKLLQLSRCGDGGLQAHEECDDANTANNDGCSALCQREAVNLPEVEPNDTTPLADGPITSSTTASGNIGEAADALDLFSVQLSDLSDLSIELEPLLSPMGLCDDSPATLRLLSASGIVLAQSLPPNDVIKSNLCNQLDPRDDFGVAKLPPGTYFVEVGKGTLTAGKDYQLHINILSACGDGVVSSSEECDDNNTTNGDGCTSQCLFETLSPRSFVESEPNEDGTPTVSNTVNGNDFSIVNADGPFTTDAFVFGSIGALGDEDVFKITNPTGATQSMRVEVFSQEGFGFCNGMDPVLALHNAAGTQISFDDSTGVNFCALLTFTLGPNETVFVRLFDFNDNALVRGYQLLIDFL